MKTILIVEDVEFNLDLLVQLLEDDYTVLTASDGAAGMALTERECPDLILMDLSLPVIDGWEVTRRLKANAKLRHIPITALTAHAMSGDEEKAILYLHALKQLPRVHPHDRMSHPALDIRRRSRNNRSEES